MSFALFSLVIDVAAMVCVCLFGLGVVFAAGRSLNAWLIALICMGSACHQLLAWQEFSAYLPRALHLDVGPAAPVLNLARNLSPGLFMLLVHRLFVDDRPLPIGLWLAFGVQIALEAVSYRQTPSLLTALPAMLQLLFGACALYWTLALWPQDLIEGRRRVRAIVFVILTVNIVASSLMLRLVMPSSPYSFDLHQTLSIFGLATVLYLWFRNLKVAPAAFESLDPKPAAAPSPPPTTLDDQAAIRSLHRLIAEERLYLDPGLSLQSLAHRMGLPQYRLRRVIHEGLGQRNFNAFLHSVRIAEACRWLDDPKTARLPFLTIALSVGYNSANTFNRGFREVMGCTPSDYRARTRAVPEKPLQVLQSA